MLTTAIATTAMTAWRWNILQWYSLQFDIDLANPSAAHVPPEVPSLPRLRVPDTGHRL